MKKYLLGILSIVVVCWAIDPYTDVGTDTVLYNRTNRNVRPNGANQIFNNLGGTNLTVESNIVAGESITVGRTNSTTSGSITLGTTNFTLIVKLTINTNGDFIMSDGTNTMMVLKKASGSDGTTNKFLAADGHYYTSSGDTIWTNSAGTIQSTNGVVSININGQTIVSSDNSTGFLQTTSASGSSTIYSAGALGLTSLFPSGIVTLNPGAQTNNVPFSFVDTADLGPDGVVYNVTSGSGGVFQFLGDGKLLISNSGVTNLYIKAPTGVKETSLWVFDFDAGSLQHVTVGTADSGGTGFKVLRIPN